jgi:hypothetical protein
VLDVRVAEFADIAAWFSLSVQANWRFVRISATSRSVVNMLAGVSYTKEAPIQLLGKIKIETNAAFEAYDLCPRSAQSLACPRQSPTPPLSQEQRAHADGIGNRSIRDYSLRCLWDPDRVVGAWQREPGPRVPQRQHTSLGGNV